MVRKTIACSRCRRSKVKCVHSGKPPCQACTKGGAGPSGTCTLSWPSQSRSKRPSHSPYTQTRQLPPRRQTPLLSPPEHVESPGLAAGHQPHQPSLDRVVDATLILRAGTLFREKFPELAFLHLPTFRELVRDMGRGNGPSPGLLRLERSAEFGTAAALCAALLTVTLPFLQPNKPRNQYADCAKQIVAIDDLPEIFTVQTLLVLSIYEWSNGRPYRAWTYTGMATRMMQLISSTTEPTNYTEVQSEIHNRTLWSCFVLDRLVICGRPQPPAIPLESIDTYWPSREADFVFGQPGDRISPKDGPGPSLVEDVDGYFALLAQGIDIWADVLKWILRGGRRHPEVVASKEAPWTKGASWQCIYERLRGWRQRHGGRIRFPDVNVGTHVALKGGHGEAFSYINLIYYVSTLFLCREYIPFLPTPASKPSGPIDPPLLDDPGPPGWWNDRANDLFEAGSNITALLRQLRDEDALLLTPFAGFCAFSAATMNIYVACFPQMNLDRSRGREADFESDLAYLDEFRGVWPLGAGWWTAAQRTKDLYRQASADYSTYEGKSRDDFIALESSMHNCTGVSPELNAEENAACSPTSAPSTFSGPESSHQISQESAVRHAAMGSQELSYSHITGEAAIPASQILSSWNEPLGLWGDEQIDPLGVEGSLYEHLFRY